MTYSDRKGSTNSDGSPLFATDYDKAREAEICTLVEQEWHCSMMPFGPLCPVDFYAIRDGRMVGVMELKSRTHKAYHYPTVFLNVRKWIALSMASAGLGVPAIFMVRFTDEIRFINVAKVDATKFKMGGTKKIVKSHTDIEPVIEVPVTDMTALATRPRATTSCGS